MAKEPQVPDNRYETIFHSLPLIAFTLDTKGNVVDANDYTKKFFGLKPDDFFGKPFSKCVKLGKMDLLRAFSEFRKNMSGKVTGKSIYSVELKDGRKVIIELAGVPIKENGNVVKVLDVGSDITERMKAEDELHKSEKRFQDVALISADWIWEVDKSGRYVFVSGKVKDILGYSSEELIGKTPFDLMPEEEAKRVGEAFKKIISEKKPIVNMENWNISKNGKKVILLTNGVPILDEKRNLLGYRGIDKDITERKKIEDEINSRTEELEKYNKFAVGRELKMVELKNRIKELEEKLAMHGGK